MGNTRANYLSDEMRGSLEELCPSFQPGLLGCCDGKSVEVMKSLLGLAGTVIWQTLQIVLPWFIISSMFILGD